MDPPAPADQATHKTPWQRTVHVLPGHPGAERVHHRELHGGDRLEYHALVGRKLAGGREGAGDVGAVAGVLAAHVEEEHVAGAEHAVVGRGGVAWCGWGACVVW